MLLFVSTGFYSRWRYIKKTKALLQNEKNRSENLLLNILPSGDTAVCAQSIRQSNQDAAKEADADVLCVSADLPFAADRFCAAEGIENVKTASFFRTPTFMQTYGVRLTGSFAGLAARAVVVINAQGAVVYTELVDEITKEPNYQAALDALKSA